ncbi:integrase [Meridianimarinicoccus roseus]|uniref:Integrase n=1 Tax=Meridianimarinicoccus roseus TaxID=2072018 RepID=A0A2V2L9P6_9RHOB|nr:tyrosine-type recombinase/integrase [Meridianimarinicoccus roseus]PWR01952.1 integrase [Meridianimarinicoccus roseus]
MTAPARPPAFGLQPSGADGALTQADLDTLSHLLRAGMGANSLRALRSDLDYLEAWSRACTGAALAWPPERDTILRFIAHHLWDPAQRRRAADHGMPARVDAALRAGGHLRAPGPHAPATVRRRLSSWRSLCKWRAAGDPFGDPVVRRTLAAAVRAADRPRQRKSERVVDGALMGRLMEHLSPLCAPTPFARRDLERDRLAALRDRAMLAIAFASGGRRRSEISDLMVSALEDQPPVPDAAGGADLPSLALHLGRTKTTDADEGAVAHVTGAPVRFLRAWRAAARIAEGPVFRRIDRWGNVSGNGIGAQGLNAVLKARLAQIGEDPARFSAHGLRAGYITEALNRGLGVHEIMGQTQHRSVKTAMGYAAAQDGRVGRAARLME